MSSYAQRRPRRRSRTSLWHKFVLLVGYGTLVYGLVRLILLLLVRLA